MSDDTGRFVGYTEAIAKPSFLGRPGVDEGTTRNHPTSLTSGL
jgi:hypothetical protein